MEGDTIRALNTRVIGGYEEGGKGESGPNSCRDRQGEATVSIFLIPGAANWRAATPIFFYISRRCASLSWFHCIRLLPNHVVSLRVIAPSCLHVRSGPFLFHFSVASSDSLALKFPCLKRSEKRKSKRKSSGSTGLPHSTITAVRLYSFLTVGKKIISGKEERIHETLFLCAP